LKGRLGGFKLLKASSSIPLLKKGEGLVGSGVKNRGMMVLSGLSVQDYNLWTFSP